MKAIKGMTLTVWALCCLMAMGCERNGMDVRSCFNWDGPDIGTVADDSIWQWMSDVICEHFDWTLLKTYDDMQTPPLDGPALNHYYNQGIGHAVEEYGNELNQRKGQKVVHAIYIDTLSFKVLCEDDCFITYQAKEVNSMGDTHPMRYDSFVSFNKATGQRITFGQLFAPEKRKDIVQRVFDKVDSLKQDFSPEMPKVIEYIDINKLDFSKVDADGYPRLAGISATSEFYFHNPAFTADGLLFYFYVDELRAYIEGQYNVVIPYTELTNELLIHPVHLLQGFK